ncbi:MAG: hypothetical protein MHM6MM_006593 [Cercozoa sp. M6MM]
MKLLFRALVAAVVVASGTSASRSYVSPIHRAPTASRYGTPTGAPAISLEDLLGREATAMRREEHERLAQEYQTAQQEHQRQTSDATARIPPACRAFIELFVDSKEDPRSVMEAVPELLAGVKKIPDCARVGPDDIQVFAASVMARRTARPPSPGLWAAPTPFGAAFPAPPAFPTAEPASAGYPGEAYRRVMIAELSPACQRVVTHRTETTETLRTTTTTTTTTTTEMLHQHPVECAVDLHRLQQEPVGRYGPTESPGYTSYESRFGPESPRARGLATGVDIPITRGGGPPLEPMSARPERSRSGPAPLAAAPAGVYGGYPTPGESMPPSPTTRSDFDAESQLRHCQERIQKLVDSNPGPLELSALLVNVQTAIDEVLSARTPSLRDYENTETQLQLKERAWNYAIEYIKTRLGLILPSTPVAT